MGRRLRVLCLDIEGGHGGSSRSLHSMLRHVDQDRVALEVWCRRTGPTDRWYSDLGIPHRVCPEMPKVSSLPRFSRNLYVYAKAALEFRRSRGFRNDLVHEINRRFDVVHLNHEALFLLARWLAPRVAIPLTMHIRTNLWPTVFARWQTSQISTHVNHRVFITDNEKDTYLGLGGKGAGTVVYNVAEPPAAGVKPYPGLAEDKRLKVACLSNYSWMRGVDRLVDVAKEFQSQGRADAVFIVAGDMKLTRSLPGKLGELGRQGGTLEDYARSLGVQDYFRFIGHVDEPERVLAGCDALIKPTRENNPWGRDILEALACGLPVFSIGSYDRFVSNGETGFLYATYAAAAIAHDIASLAEDRDLCKTLGRRAAKRVARLCAGRTNAAKLETLWAEVAAWP